MVEENKLQLIVKESGLEPAKATIMLEKFQNYFEIAAEWEQKAKTLIVTDATQTAEMQMAKVGRLFLRDKRIAVEKTRKELKEQALREGKAIDGIANVLKALIVPIEQHLEQQEKFGAIQKAKEENKIRQEIEERMEAERIAKEKAEAEEQERIRVENEKLKAEAVEREKKILADKKRAMTKLATEKKITKEETERLQKILDEQVECPFCHKKFTLGK